MADNVTANPASGGAVFATDNKGGTENWPISKIGYGARDTDYYIVSSATPLPVQEATSVTYSDASQTVSTSAVTALAGGTATKVIKIQNCSQSGQVVGYTFDGTTPVIGAAGTFLLTPYGSDIFEHRIPAGAIKVIGSASSTIVSIKYA